MNINTWRPLVIICSVTVLFYLVERQAKQSRPRSIEGHTFRYGSLMLISLSALTGVFAWGFFSESSNIRWLFFSLLIIMSVVTVCAFSTSAAIQDGALQIKRLFRRASIPVDQIAEIDKNCHSGHYTIYDRQRRQYIISSYLSGADALIRYLREHCQPFTESTDKGTSHPS